MRSVAKMGGDAVFTPPCSLSIENRQGNAQGGVRMTPPPGLACCRWRRHRSDCWRSPCYRGRAAAWRCRKSEKDAKLAQKLGQLQPFIAVFPQQCMGQLASSGTTILTPFSLRPRPRRQEGRAGPAQGWRDELPGLCQGRRGGRRCRRAAYVPHAASANPRWVEPLPPPAAAEKGVDRVPCLGPKALCSLISWRAVWGVA